MASTKELEDTLPLRDSSQFSDTLDKQWPIYFMVAFDDQELRQLEGEINKAEDSTDHSILITQPKRFGSTLRVVYDRHIQLRDERKDIHPSLFIVVDQKEYQTGGVLIVDLRVMASDGQSVVGVLRCAHDDADLYCANLDIGNMSFVDYRKEEQRLWGGDDPYENQRYFPKDPDSDLHLATPPTTLLHYAWYSNVEMGTWEYPHQTFTC
jgi:hypothetical protein